MKPAAAPRAPISARPNIFNGHRFLGVSEHTQLCGPVLVWVTTLTSAQPGGAIRTLRGSDASRRPAGRLRYRPSKLGLPQRPSDVFGAPGSCISVKSLYTLQALRSHTQLCGPVHRPVPSELGLLAMTMSLLGSTR
jgi:hypothetical protein